jgi:predicted NBD/HSP70 family sugar kinase
MYIGVDIGGTKTLVATFSADGNVLDRQKFLTPPTYENFLHELEKTAAKFLAQDLRAGCIAAPGVIDRVNGIGKDFGNLSWHNVPIEADAQSIFHCPIVVENDANLGGLSESMLLPKDKRILYVTISTGIGTGFIDNQSIVPDLADSEGGHMLLEHHGKRMIWESFASGHAIAERFGKKASDITDPIIWNEIAHDLTLGFIELIAIAQPDIIVIGGSVGRYFDQFKRPLVREVKQCCNTLLKMPLFQQAARPDDAVLYGCYELARNKYGSTS